MFPQNLNDNQKCNIRQCGNTFEYCDGVCDMCAKSHVYYTTNTVDYMHRDTITTPISNNHAPKSSYSILGIDKDTYCKTIGPWGWYRTLINSTGDLL